MQPLVEMRSAKFVDAEVKGFKMRGYAAVFDSPWNAALIERTGYVEKTARGTFRKALARSPRVPLRWLDHLNGDVLATTHAGTLKLREDGKGLEVRATLPESPLGEHARAMVERGDVSGMSYGITTLPSDSTVSRDSAGVYYRTITNAQEMLDVTLTWEPAYDSTSVELRTVGFAAVPLQALVQVGQEGQTEPDAATSPDEPPGWWGDEPDESSAPAPVITRRRAWEIVIDELEKDGEYGA